MAPNTQLSDLDGQHATTASASCECDAGSRRFYTPSDKPIPDDSYNASTLAFVLDSTSNCPDMCFCDAIDSQRCYVPQGKNVYVEFVPFCEGIFFRHPCVTVILIYL